MEQLTVRGAAAAMLAATIALPLGAQVAVGGTRPRDSVVVRVDGASMRVRLDSIARIMSALEEESPLSPLSMKLRAKLEAMMRELASTQRLGLGMGGGEFGTTRITLGGPEGALRAFAGPRFKGYIGITTDFVVPHTEDPTADGFFIRYWKYPPIISVDPNSPAQRAGIAPGDILVAYDGSDVVARAFNASQLFVPDRKLSVTVRRDGESKEFAMTVATPPNQVVFRRLVPGEMASGFDDPQVKRLPKLAVGMLPGGTFVMARAGVLGLSLTTVNPDLAKTLKIEIGALVNEVVEGTPAYKAGMRTGDVIVSVAGQAVTSVSDVQSQVAARGADHSVDVQVVRDKKPRTFTVKW